MKLLAMAAATLLSLLFPAVAMADDDPYYVALGDSRAIGPTWTSGLSGDHCGRTADAYPVKVAARLGLSYRSVACGGATTTDLLKGQRVVGLLPVPPQVEALSAKTRLVTLSIGGNDIGWYGLIKPCFPLIGADGRCRYNAAMQRNIDRKLAALGPKVDRVLAEIRRRSPDTRIVVVGHGGYFGDRGCAPDAPMSNADAPTVAAFFARFNGVLRRSATRAGADFVDITGPAKGHDACAAEGQKWFLGDWPHGESQTRHPTRLGSLGMAMAVVATLHKNEKTTR